MVTLRQMATMVILFLIGSSSLFLLGGTAERDAWMSVAVGVLAGFVVISLVTLQSAAADVVRLAILDGVASAEPVSTPSGDYGAYGGQMR